MAPCPIAAERGSIHSGTSFFPAEQARIVQLLVERVDVGPDGVDLRLRTEGVLGAADVQIGGLLAGLPDPIRRCRTDRRPG